jgi:tetratricopeptide (TPR) repeat protein
LLCAIFVLPLSVTNADDLGSISFPNSGAPEAQEAFLTGVKALHSFQFDEARFAFEDAQELDPSFALAYWGQAMSDNHPLWAQQDGEAALAALKRLAPTFEGRLARSPGEKEKAFMTAIETLYFSPGDKLTRDNAYAAYMAAMQDRWPDDHEIAVFHALSLLGTVRPGDRGYRRQAQAAAIALDVFAENPSHPGAAHFVIHAFDDPDHAILALPAAKVYAGIAPAAAHALHMPSHIFLQLGMWDGVVSSNIDAYAAAIAGNKKYGLAEGREDFHTLSWLAYANLMLGHYDRAEENVSRAVAARKRNPDSMMVHSGYLDMRGRHILETGEWQDLELASMESMEGRHANWVAVVGMNAAQLGDMEVAAAAEARLKALGKAAMSDGKSYDAKVSEVLVRQVMALRMLKSGDSAGAIAAAKEASRLEMTTLRMPSGPPKPMKPAAELYAEILLESGQAEAAMVAFRESLQWIPQRTPSMRGLAMAAEKAGDAETAKDMIEKLRSMPGANLGGPAFSAVMKSTVGSGR